MRILICLTITLLVASTSFAQNNIQIDKLKGQVTEKIKSKPLSMSGAFALNGIATAGITPNPQPFTYVATGNVNLNVYGYSLPFSFTYSNRKFGYTNPSFQFNRSAFNPRYKQWAGHFGDVNMSFSPYTLSGVQFKGAGLEYMPKKWKCQVLAGRFMKAVAEDTSGKVRPSFKRIGLGIKGGYYADKMKFGVSIFYAKDAQNSIPTPKRITYYDVTPMENVAFALETGFPIFKNLTWDSEISTSVLTQDLKHDVPNNTESVWSKPFLTLLPKTNISSKVYHATKTALNYTIGQLGMVGVAYERVDPEYRSLGGYYFTNDFENITVNSQYRGKNINLQFSTGLQRDDLANSGKSSLNRMVVSANTSFKPMEKMDFSANYSNFQSYTFIRSPFDKINRVTPFDNLDTLNFTQLSQNAGVNINYNLKQDSTGSQAVTANVNFMESANQRNLQGSIGTTFINAALNYNRSFAALNLNIATGFIYSLSLGQTPSKTLGPTLSASKQLFNKKVAATGSFAYNRSLAANAKTDVFNLSTGANMTLKEKHNVNLNLSQQYRTATQQKASFNFTATAGYNYTFSDKKSEKRKVKMKSEK